MLDLTILVSLGNIAIRTLTQTQLAAQINAIMGDLGVQEVKNAKRALQDALRSSDPRHELISAVNHFQSAASNFTADSSHGKAAECYAAIATIYASLGEHQIS
jgi:hypothetical protein